MAITVGYPQTNRKTDTGKTLTRWPVFVDHFSSIDRTYTLIRKPRRVAPMPAKSMVINYRNDRSDEAIAKFRKAAERRARLIANGIYLECMG